MKTPLLHQATEYDCAIAATLDAFLYLFDREEIPYELVHFVNMSFTDKYWGPDDAHGGTSAAALAHFAEWLTSFATRAKFPAHASFLRGDDVSVEEGSAVYEALMSGGVAVLGCAIGADHYVLATGIADDGRIQVFDPYYDCWPMHNLSNTTPRGVELISCEPFSYNRLIEPWVFEEPNETPYSLNARSGRDALIIKRVG